MPSHKFSVGNRSICYLNRTYTFLRNKQKCLTHKIKIPPSSYNPVLLSRLFGLNNVIADNLVKLLENWIMRHTFTYLLT